jgi:sigma-E factor negative regulatory protein RseC
VIEEWGTVVQLHGRRALVRTERSHACDGCASAGFCNLSEGDEACTVEAENPGQAAVGEKVRVAIPTSRFLTGTFFLYLFPLIGLFLGMAVGSILARVQSSGETELFAACGSLLGLLLFFLLQRLLNSRFEKSGRFRPVIVGVVR